MTKEKQTADLAKILLCSLVVITLSLFLGLTASEAENMAPVDKSLAVILKMEESKIRTANAKIEKETTEAELAGKASTKKVHNEEIVDGSTQEETKVVVSDARKEAPEYICSNANRGGAASRKETDVLIHLINAEAYGLSYKAKVAVGQVVMNRWTGPYYGDDLLSIMTAPYQFTPIYNGSAYEKEVEPDSIKAAYTVLEGSGVNELTNDTYYFVNPDFTEDKTIEQKMDFVCEIEGIHFYKPPVK